MPIAEIYVIVKVGEVIGVLPTLILLVLDAVVGAALLRREGRRTWAAFRRAVSDGRLPTREVADGALVIFGGALMIAPGFLTDVVGLVCVLPPTRALLRRLLWGRTVLGRLVMGRAPSRGPAQHEVVDGEVIPPHDTGPRPQGS
ncbi:MAG: FxsA family protein [Actinomycetota bacterium]|nr:FxsA family protein [Actinomycetota bacterium]